MQTPYQIIRQKKNSNNKTPRKTFTPTNKKMSFWHDSLKTSPDRQRVRRKGDHLIKNETEGNHTPVELPQSHTVEVVVRENQKKRPTYRFTYTESFIMTEGTKIHTDGNFRLVIEGGHCRRDLLKLNRRKLEDMISKIRDGGPSTQGPSSSTAQMILQQCKPRSSVFLKGQSRKSDWKVHSGNNTGSPDQFDTRDFLMCHSMRKDMKKTPKKHIQEEAILPKKAQLFEGSPREEKKKIVVDLYNRFAKAKQKKMPSINICKTEARTINSSMNCLDRSSPSKRLQTATSCNIGYLKGWQSTQQTDSFLWEGSVFD